MKKNLKIILISALSLCVILTLGYFLRIFIVKKSAIKTVDEAMKSVKEFNASEAQKYLNVPVDTEDQNANEILICLVQNLDYKIVSTKCNLNKCELTLEVTNKDLKTVVSNYVTNLFSLALSNAFGKISDEDMKIQSKEYLLEQYNSDAIENVTSTVTVTAKKENGKLILEFDKEQLGEAILPGYVAEAQYLNSFNKDIENSVN